MNSWYQQLVKPVTVPPDWVFGPVWSILYLLLGIGIYLFITAPPRQYVTLSYIVIALHLVVNFSWSYLFFSRHLILIAFIDCLLILITLIILMILFHANRPLAAYLQIPYLLWVSFACYLNLHIYLLNKSA